MTTGSAKTNQSRKNNTKSREKGRLKFIFQTAFILFCRIKIRSHASKGKGQRRKFENKGN
ncbi:hypothetical protein HMPREF2711_04975 [Neisseria sp. HMSC070A01]|uniref:Uncharacterized protein n=1 Tax=Neisseria mucosa C102 TaxID=435832 RepID=A0ABN0CAM9_NEIMU|nr:hypothetical protein HMPREF0604_01186 [Neisseria mucosa C102]OFM22707.1 hypothetical protein HMPREF2711_04975 [Neisseria sp. HMSC070A01]